MRDYSKDFAEWRKWRDEKGLPPIYDNPADAGFCKPELSGRCVYLDYDCYWFPTELKSLKPYRK